MKLFKKQLFWTVLEIWIYDEEIDENDLENIFEIVQNFENKYSRFKKWNYLWKLNKDKSAEIDEDLQTIINIAKKANELSKWHFDLTILPYLEEIWYWIYEENLEKNIWMENIFIENWKIFLKNNVCIEVWWIWKGYMVDVIFNNLKEKYKNFVVNFWWDIRILWEKREFFLENPENEKNFIWKIKIENLALAYSWANNWCKNLKTTKWNFVSLCNAQTSEFSRYFRNNFICESNWYFSRNFETNRLTWSYDSYEKLRYLQNKKF